MLENLEAQLKDADPGAEAEVDSTDTVEETAETEEDTQPSLEDQLAERTEDLQRLSAEYANYRRRTERERKAGVENVKAQVLTQLLPILDDLELAEQHGDLEQGPLKSFRDKFVSVLDTFKVTPFGAAGEVFDPERHEAVQDLSTGDDKYIGTVLRLGYQVEERLLRTAMVIIVDPVDSEAESTAEDDTE
ncbi:MULTISPECIES: nucleotide exchange factor GrpE [unclassified Corynebacterium]|uniref:nucleotide exchange factor GrpE n=1 Tax=Corynebacterium sp. sy017 TaxID=2499527 RepID=UPI001FEE05D3|nr:MULTISPECIES: nucleotide exchange factor GrpE [unclassified Corynebacterium]